MDPNNTNNPASAANGGGTAEAGQDWRGQLLGETAATESPEMFEYMSRFKTPADAIKSHYEEHRLNTRKTDEIKAEIEAQYKPAAEMDEAALKAFADRIRPAAKDGYAVKVPEGMEAYFPNDQIQEMVDFVYDELGLPPSISNKLMQKHVDRQAAVVQAIQDEAAKQRAEDDAAIRKELAEQGKNYDEFMTISQRGRDFMAKAAGMEPDKFGELLAMYGMDTHPAFIKAHAALGDMVRDAKFVGDNQDGGNAQKPMSQYEKNKARWPETPDMWGDPDA